MAAVPLLLRVLQIQSENLPAHGMLASLYAGTALLAAQPVAREGYVRCLAVTGDLPGAIEQLQQVVAASPTDTNPCDLAELE